MTKPWVWAPIGLAVLAGACTTYADWHGYHSPGGYALTLLGVALGLIGVISRPPIA